MNPGWQDTTGIALSLQELSIILQRGEQDCLPVEISTAPSQHAKGYVYSLSRLVCSPLRPTTYMYIRERDRPTTSVYRHFVPSAPDSQHALSAQIFQDRNWNWVLLSLSSLSPPHLFPLLSQRVLKRVGTTGIEF